MRLSRRQFLKYCVAAAGVLGLSNTTVLKLNEALADIQGTGPDVVWIPGQACSGCITSLLNSMFYMDVGTLLLDTIDLNFESTVSAAPGYWLGTTKAANSVIPLAPELMGNYVLLVEGSCPTAAPPGGTPGDYCHVGEIIAGVSEKYTDQLVALASNAAAVLAIGTCSSFGGIPAARGSSTGATDTRTFLASQSVATPVVRVPGCPPHPDWIVGTVIQYMADPTLSYLAGNLNSDGAPREYYGEYICNAGPCTWRYQNNQTRSGTDYDSTYPEGNSKALGAGKWIGTAQGCLGILGCKGRKTKADCSGRKWNAAANQEYGVGWCVGSRAGCHGCTNPAFPDGVGKFFTMA